MVNPRRFVKNKFDNLRRFARRGIRPVPEPKIAVREISVHDTKEVLEHSELRPEPMPLHFSFSGTWFGDVKFIFDPSDIIEVTYPHVYLLYGVPGMLSACYDFVPRHFPEAWTCVHAAETETEKNTIPLSKVDHVVLMGKGEQLRSDFRNRGIEIGRLPTTPLGRWLSDVKTIILDKFDDPREAMLPDHPPGRRLSRMVMSYNDMVIKLYDLNKERVLSDAKKYMEERSSEPWW